MESVTVITEARNEGVLANVAGPANGDDEGILTHLIL